MIGILVVVIILGLLWFGGQESAKRSEEKSRVAREALHHLASFLRECTGFGPWLEMDEFYRVNCVDVKCTKCTRDTIFVSNANASRETEFIDVHFVQGKLRIMYGMRVLFDGDPLILMSYPEESFPLKKENPPPKESGTYYSAWVELFKEIPIVSRTGTTRLDSTPQTEGEPPDSALRPKPEPNQGSTDSPSPVSAYTPQPTVLLPQFFDLLASRIQAREEERKEPFQTFLEERSEVKAYIEAAERGDVDAQYKLGVLYDLGKDVPKDRNKAAWWYYKAAEQGNDKAQFGLANVYNDWRFDLFNLREAAAWFRKAAEQGNAEAQESLGGMYSSGYSFTKLYGGIFLEVCWPFDQGRISSCSRGHDS